ncbi:hypothetical protein [Gilliamella sp. Bif1-4]|uniref:hypothetical protein n=1 Tax=Gilliamella sp. Bif1-4 TaxID=3120233 RepID=UPI001146DE34|nr:hypothetical protein [Gilliamella apicola]
MNTKEIDDLIFLVLKSVDIPINNFYIDDKDYQAICYSWHAQLLDQLALSHFYQINQILKKIKVETILPETFITRLIQIKTELFTHNQCNSNLVKHLFIELLIRLSAFGVYFPLNNNPKISQKIREIINQQPDKKWQAAEIAKQFAMSESTLRRHLALEGYNLSKIILDIRMNFGLMLLQTTQKRSYKLPKKWDMNQTLVLLFTLNNVLDLHQRGYVSQFFITNI